MSSVAKAWSFLAILSLTLVVLGHAHFGRSGLLFALVGSLGINSFIYLYEDRRILNIFKGQYLDGQDSYGLFTITRRLAAKARITVPRIVILPDTSPQSAAVGRGFSNGTLLLTQGTLNKFSGRELEAIVAYQVASIRQLNTLAFAVGSFIVSLLLFVTGVLDSVLRLLIVEKKNIKAPVSQVFTRMISPFVGILLRFSIHKSFYRNADRLAAQLLDDPKILAKVFWKMDAYSHTLPMAVPLPMAHMFMVSPLTLASWTKCYVAQPQVEVRIRELLGYYPI